MSTSLARLQSWLLWIAGVLAVLGAVGAARLPLQLFFLQANILMPIVGLMCLGAAFIVAERAGLEASPPSLSRRIRIWALLVLGILSFMSLIPVISLPLDVAFVRLDMLMLLVGLACLVLARTGTRA